MEPLFTTERLLIRRFSENDWPAIYDYLSDPEVVAFEPYDPITEEQARVAAADRADSHAFYAICLRDGGRLIGNLYLEKGDFDTWELGYALHRAFQRQGYATEAASALLAYAFSQLNARRITAMCSDRNTASWHLLERLGMRREGLFLQNVAFKKDADGKPVWFDSYAYGLLKSEWEETPVPKCPQ